MVLVVGAMVEELQVVITDFHLQPVLNSIFPEFKNQEKSLVVCATGIGIVNAGAGLAYLLTKYQKVDYILVLGTAGATSQELKQGDLVLVEKAIYAFADVTSFGYQLGQVPKMPPDYEADEALTSKVFLHLNKKYPLKLVNAATADFFVETKKQVQDLISKLPLKTTVADMELASFYQVAYLFGLPIVALKIVSDSTESSKTSKQEFNHFLPKASQQLSKILKIITKNVH